MQHITANCPHRHVALTLISTSEQIENRLHSDWSCSHVTDNCKRPRARPTSSDASQLSHWCSRNPFPNEHLARPSLSRQIEWHTVMWTNGEGVELQTEWKWPRETEGDTERETEMEGGIKQAYSVPTHFKSPCCHFVLLLLLFLQGWFGDESPYDLHPSTQA